MSKFKMKIEGMRYLVISCRLGVVLSAFLVCAFSFTGLMAQENIIPFDTANWVFLDGSPVEFMGRPALKGSAILKNRTITDGVVEFDMAVTGQRSYPGVLFRITTDDNYERIYIRPHLPVTFQNVIQYVSTFNDIDSWQLYNGPGYTASAAIPKNEWFHVKLEFSGGQAQMFLKDEARPALEVPHLGHGAGSGRVGLSGPADGSAYFSRFSCHENKSLVFQPQVAQEIPFGIITNWEISQVFKAALINNEVHPDKQGLEDVQWKATSCRPDGIVDISRYHPRSGNSPDLILARATVVSEKDEHRLFTFGYSDLISVFLNGELVFIGNSSYMSRDPSFQGIIGMNDYVNLPLKKGKNELMLMVTESFGGWGFIFRDCSAMYLDSQVTRGWEIRNRFRYPESAEYDPKRKVIYVSNYYLDAGGSIAKLRTDGTVAEAEWVKGVFQPSGLCLSGDRLYAVGRQALVEIDPDQGAIVNRYPFPDPGLPNDVCASDDGELYITDSFKGRIYRLKEGKMERWLESPELARVNGIMFENGRILAGTSSDGCVKIIYPETKKISMLDCIGSGSIIDGLASDGKGNYLVGDFSGKVFRINSSGGKKLLINTTAAGISLAAFCYIPEKGLLVVPTLYDNRVITFRIRPEE
jgi:hypothetical protein